VKNLGRYVVVVGDAAGNRIESMRPVKFHTYEAAVTWATEFLDGASVGGVECTALVADRWKGRLMWDGRNRRIASAN
jgi:hypothetical protein